MTRKLKIKFKESEYKPEALKPFKITKANAHLYEIQNDVILKKSRKKDFLVVNTSGIIIGIEGSNVKNKKIGDSIYE